MKINKTVTLLMISIGLFFSSSVLAVYPAGWAFGSSDFDSNNGLHITTTTGDFFVPNSDSGAVYGGSGAGANYHDALSKNYYAGTCCNRDVKAYDINNYFTFDLSTIGGTVLSASLMLNSFGVFGLSLEYSLFDLTSSSLKDLSTSGFVPDAYNDMMSGISYGSYIYSDSDSGLYRSLVLNDDGISALNGAIGGEFGIGGHLVVIASIPEPRTYAMLLAGLGWLGFTAYRRKRLING